MRSTPLCGHLIRFWGAPQRKEPVLGRPSRYPPEFRREAVELVGTLDRSVVEVARSLGITDSTSHNWLKADREAKARAGDPTG